MGRRKIKRGRVWIAIMALCGRQCRGSASINETDFIQNFRMTSTTFNRNVLFLSLCFCCMPAWTEAAFLLSDLEPVNNNIIYILFSYNIIK